MPQRRKLQKDFILADNTGNITTTASGYTCEVLRNGARMASATEMQSAPFLGNTAGCANPGSLRSGDLVYIMEDGVVDTSFVYQIDEIFFSAGFVDANQTEDAYSMTFVPASYQNYTPTDANADLRLVLVPATAAHRVQLWNSDFSSDDNEKDTNPFPLDSGGGIDTYLSYPQVDLYVTDGTNSQWYTDVDTMQEGRSLTPQDFGAAGDGTTDDAHPIANCLAHIGLLADGGINSREEQDLISTIKIPAGTYNIADGQASYLNSLGIPFYAGSIIEGDGRDRTILKWTGTGGQENVLYTSDKFATSGVTIRDLTIEVDHVAGTDLTNVLYIGRGLVASRVALERVNIKVTNTPGTLPTIIRISGSGQVTLSDVYLDGGSSTTNAIVVASSSDNINIESCFIENVTNGVNIDTTDKVRIRNTNIEGYTGDGMYLSNACDQISFLSNIIDGESAGDTCIKLNATTTNCVVLGNNLTGAVTAELDLNGATDSEVQRGFNTGTEQA